MVCKILAFVDDAQWYRVAQQKVNVEAKGVGHEIFVVDTPYSDVTGFTALNAATLEVSMLATGGVPHIFQDKKFRTVVSPRNWFTTRPYSENVVVVVVKNIVSIVNVDASADWV